MAGIGHCSAYRIRDELNTERAAQGKPPIAANQWRAAAGKRAAKAAEWLDGAADILRFRALIIELGYDAAIPAMKREIRERDDAARAARERSEEHTSELQSLMRNSYAVFCLKKKKNKMATYRIISTSIITQPIPTI